MRRDPVLTQFSVFISALEQTQLMCVYVLCAAAKCWLCVSFLCQALTLYVPRDPFPTLTPASWLYRCHRVSGSALAVTPTSTCMYCIPLVPCAMWIGPCVPIWCLVVTFERYACWCLWEQGWRSPLLQCLMLCGTIWIVRGNLQEKRYPRALGTSCFKTNGRGGETSVYSHCARGEDLLHGSG